MPQSSGLEMMRMKATHSALCSGAPSRRTSSITSMPTVISTEAWKAMIENAVGQRVRRHRRAA